MLIFGFNFFIIFSQIDLIDFVFFHFKAIARSTENLCRTKIWTPIALVIPAIARVPIVVARKTTTRVIVNVSIMAQEKIVSNNWVHLLIIIATFTKCGSMGIAAENTRFRFHAQFIFFH